jgi:membrane carboxypeptidase/penicillin-binding protein PbpC
LRLRTTLDASAAVHWFLDGRYLGESRADRPLDLDLVPGDHTLSAALASGEAQAATSRFRVLP